MSMKYPQYLAWVDAETTGTPTHGDYSDVHILEIAVIVTDFALQPFKGYQAVIKMTDEAAKAIRENEFVLNMHKKSGLLADSVKSPEAITLAKAEDDILDLLNGFGETEQFMIAGSGVAAFDHPLIKVKMHKFDARLAYFPFDVGVLRRSSKILAGRDVVNPTVHSYGDLKEHRALADVKAHLAEAKTFQTYFRDAVLPTH